MHTSRARCAKVRGPLSCPSAARGPSAERGRRHDDAAGIACQKLGLEPKLSPQKVEHDSPHGRLARRAVDSAASHQHQVADTGKNSAGTAAGAADTAVAATARAAVGAADAQQVRANGSSSASCFFSMGPRRALPGHLLDGHKGRQTRDLDWQPMQICGVRVVRVPEVEGSGREHGAEQGHAFSHTFACAFQEQCDFVRHKIWLDQQALHGRKELPSGLPTRDPLACRQRCVEGCCVRAHAQSTCARQELQRPSPMMPFLARTDRGVQGDEVGFQLAQPHL
mmetsp:Transcript_72524/g.183596  ORF Transcript_72524/g.183596 Transcript_72524/m.183596 type:complete len:281 (-) Transcript_72524:806-1648(-)